jgi:hypothetical protein
MTRHGLLPSALLLLAAAAAAQVDPAGRSILFVRGADGTGGLGSGTFQQRTAHLSDVFDLSTAPGNHGFGQLRNLLVADGFQVSQVIESSAPLTLAQLMPHRIVVMGSNNKTYSPAEVADFHAYIDAGGSALFVSDANWGPVWGAAPISDNQFLARYGVEVYQDNGSVHVLARSEAGRYQVADHPVLAGPDGAGGAADVNAYEGEGVSLFGIGAGSGGYQAASAVAATGLVVRLNTMDGSPGPFRAALPGDSALFFVERGNTRIAGHFDRNSWFNQNGTGSDLTRFHNALLAVNLFRFLASVPATATPVGSGCGTASVPVLAPDLPVLGRSQRYLASGASPNAPGLLLLGLGPAVPTPFPGGCVTQVSPTLLFVLPGPATTPNGSWLLTLPLPESHHLSSAVVTAQVLVLVSGGPLLGAGELTNGVQLRLGYPR